MRMRVQLAMKMRAGVLTGWPFVCVELTDSLYCDVSPLHVCPYSQRQSLQARD